MKYVKYFLTILLIIIIIGILFALLYPSPWTPESYEKPKYDSTRPKMVPIEFAIEKYKQNTGHLPEKLEDLLNCPTGLEHIWQGPYLVKESQLIDPWSRYFVYELKQNDPNSYVLISYGKDGKPGGKGYKADIYNY